MIYNRTYLYFCRFFLSGVLLIGAYSLYAQLAQVRTPGPTTIRHYGYGTNLNSNSASPGSSGSTFFTNAQQQQQALYQEFLANERMRKIQAQEAIQEYILHSSIVLPDYSGMKGTESFHAARKEITDMLQGRRNMNLKRAVFLTENAYYDNKLSYDRFNAEIQNLKRICLLKMKEEGLNTQDNMAVNLMIFRVITDEVSIREPATEKSITHYPMKYDFEDFLAQQDASKYMVSKLLVKNTGQCHSMPLLYLILAEELGAKAHLSLSPSHSFVKIQDSQGNWYNLELTQGAVATDDFYVGSGYIKTEAIRNQLYLAPLSSRELIAQQLIDLSSYYTRKYGYDSFVKQNADVVLAYSPSSVTALQARVTYYAYMAKYAVERCGYPHPGLLPQYPQAYALHRKMEEAYNELHDLGYAAMPEEAYRQWLESLEVEKAKPENQPSIMIQTKK